MPAKGQREKQQQAVTPAPPFYIAERSLPPGADTGLMPRAYAPGDRVPPADVEANGWRDLVSNPFAAPADGGQDTAQERAAKEE